MVLVVCLMLCVCVYQCVYVYLCHSHTSMVIRIESVVTSRGHFVRPFGGVVHTVVFLSVARSREMDEG